MQPGDVVDRYVVDGPIGRGGASNVYAVRHRTLGTRHALKVLVRASPATLSRVIVEGRAQAGIEHPNVLPVRDVIEVDGAPALLMPLVDGSSLDRLLESERLTLQEAAALFRGIVAGVAAIHHRGLVHRDLKPANVLLEVQGDTVMPRVSDFGLVIREGEVADGFAGTPRYAAPEQRRQPPRVDRRVDVWALGCILFELLSGQRWAGQLPALPGDLPDGWVALLAELVDEDPERRPADGAAVRQRLRDLPAADGTTRALAARLRRERGDPDATWAGVEPTDVPGGPIGRGADLRAVDALLDQGARVVTLHGPAGIGKTWLAHAIAGRRGSVWVAEVSTARSSLEVVTAVARATGVDLPAGLDEVQSTFGRLAGTVVLDGFDRASGVTGETVERWARASPRVAFLVTSRTVLGTPSEHVHPVGPLSVAASTELFRVRCASASPSFRPRTDEGPELAALIGLLDGIPLAIELAAARIRVLSVGQLLEHLRRDPFRVLTGAGSSLGHAIAASVEGLLPWERAAFVQLSSFEGGFTLAMADDALDLGAWPDAPWVIDVVQGLLDKSLVHRVDGPTPRFGILASLRRYARDTSPADAAAADLRHGQVLLRVASSDAIRAVVADPRDPVASELDNLLLACRRAIARADLPVAAKCFEAAAIIRHALGPLQANVELGRELLALPLAPADRCIVVRRVAEALMHAGRAQEARGLLEEALAAAGDHPETAATLGILGKVCRSLSLLEASAAAFEAAIARLRADGRTAEIPRWLSNLGSVWFDNGDLDRAEAAYRESLAGMNGTDVRNQAIIAGNLGLVLGERGRYREAMEHLRGSETDLRALGDRRGAAVALANLAVVVGEVGRYPESIALFERALAEHREIGNTLGACVALRNLGDMWMRSGDLERARTHLDEALEATEAIGRSSRVADVLSVRSALAFTEGETERAVAFARRAWTIARAAPDRWSVGAAAHHLGRALMALGESEEGRERLLESTEALRAAGSVTELGRVLWTRWLHGDHEAKAAVEELIERHRLPRSCEIVRLVRGPVDVEDTLDDQI